MLGSNERPLVYTVPQTAALLGISRTHAYELVARGDLAHVRLGRRIVIPHQTIERLLTITVDQSATPNVA
jgi:excisionase family DNA binding protein